MAAYIHVSFIAFGVWCLCGFVTNINAANLSLADEDVEMSTVDLEKQYTSIHYCLSNIGKPFTELSYEKIEDDKGFREFSPVVTYGLLAVKFQDDYRDPAKAAQYFYMDWLEYKKCEVEWLNRARKTPCDTYGSGPGEYSPLGFAIGQWKSAGLYKKALEHYPEYFDDTFLNQSIGESRDERLMNFINARKYNPELSQKYLDFLSEWQDLKKLAKSSKAIPRNSVVENHLGFYSDRRSEVLKALAYYHKHKVRFMLEKALGHKDPKVVAKSKKYLETLEKDEHPGR